MLMVIVQIAKGNLFAFIHVVAGNSLSRGENKHPENLQPNPS